MKLCWAVIGIGILTFAGSCTSWNENDDYVIKRFHIQNRHLDGKPQCVETRRKRSTREADYIKKIDIPRSSIIDQDSISSDQESNVDSDADYDNPTKIVIKHSDLVGSSGILIVQSSKSPNVPIVFAVRPVLGNSDNNKYLKMKIFDDSSFSDYGDINQGFGDFSDEVADDDFEDYSEDISGSDTHVWPLHQSSKQSKRKQSVYSPIANSEVDSEEYNLMRRKSSKKHMSSRSRIEARIKVLKEQLSQNKIRNNNGHRVQGLRIIERNDDESNSPQTNCIIIEKEPELQPTGCRNSNKGYGLRKRYKGKRKQYE